jgi:hypothetical protein
MRAQPSDTGMWFEISARSGWWRYDICYIKQTETQRQQRGAIPGAEESKVTDAHKARRQNMQQKASQELIDVQSHETLLIMVCRITPTESHLIIGKRHQSMVRDGNSMRVASQIAESMFRSSKRPLRIDNPLLTKGLSYKLREDLGASEWFQRTVKPEFAAGKRIFQRFGELTSEDFCQHVDRKEELSLGRNPSCVIRR